MRKKEEEDTDETHKENVDKYKVNKTRGLQLALISLQLIKVNFKQFKIIIRECTQDFRDLL